VTSRTDRTNRAVLALLGLLLLAAGVLGALLGFGVFGRRRQSEPVLATAVTDFVETNERWFWPVVAVVAVVLGLLALRWLAVQLRSARISGLDLEPQSSQGHPLVKSGAVTQALTEEVEGYRGVDGARARIRGKTSTPELVLDVSLVERADLDAVRRRIEEQAVAHARQALSAESMPVRLRLKLAAARPPSRVT